MLWDYEKIGLSLDQAIERLKSYGFQDNIKGFTIDAFDRHRRLHAVPSTGGIDIHIDTKQHMVKKGRKTRHKIEKVISHLNGSKIKEG